MYLWERFQSLALKLVGCLDMVIEMVTRANSSKIQAQSLKMAKSEAFDHLTNKSFDKDYCHQRNSSCVPTFTTVETDIVPHKLLGEAMKR